MTLVDELLELTDVFMVVPAIDELYSFEASALLFWDGAYFVGVFLTFFFLRS